MLCFLKSSFFKTEMIFDSIYMSYLEMHLLEGEELIKSMSPYKSGEVIAWFTNKRIIFTSSPVNISALGKTTEMEFLPYTSIQRYSFFDANTGGAYKVEIFLSDKIDFSFYASNLSEGMEILKFIGSKCSSERELS